VASVDNRLVLAGAVPAALLALAADAVLGLLERHFTAPKK
jgi:osmoprotectant transport system permease protein